MKFAAIDVGSNAARLLLAQLVDDGQPPVFKKDSLIRFPLRLGDDAFLARRITPEKAGQLVQVLAAYRQLIDAYQPVAFRACATSALREADNRTEIVEAVKRASGIDLEIVDGRTEAEIIYSNHFERNLDPDRSCLYIDVGGGSTQLTLFSQGRTFESRSFNIGAIRLLKGLVQSSTWKELKRWLKETTREVESPVAIGSGGNINKVFMLAGKKLGKPLTYKKLKEISRFISRFEVEERIRLLGLRPDRADVIVPATEIFLQVMKWARISQMYVPFIGLSDGLIHQLYENAMRQSPPASSTSASFPPAGPGLS
jgi:exopolyphosphatase/guanosine-5'-triphosphate,3'-diphosphate pyrophosphatase